MEIAKLISTLEETIALLRTSIASDRISVSPDDLVQELEEALQHAREGQQFDAKRLEDRYGKSPWPIVGETTSFGFPD